MPKQTSPFFVYKLAQLSDYIDSLPISLQHSVLFSKGTRRILRRYLLVVIGLEIWAL